MGRLESSWANNVRESRTPFQKSSQQNATQNFKRNFNETLTKNLENYFSFSKCFVEVSLEVRQVFFTRFFIVGGHFVRQATF